ncbi:hypothetical protein ACO1B2_10090 [Staphylococcus saprophyticus]|uniref:hypothetical protein n=1 Tax=Staphylococcus saprophyticus TaxID=29385 RepID=UPI003BF68F8A
MVTLIKEIQEVLNCSEQYAQKIVEYADGDEDKLNYQIDRQLYKQRNNQAIVEIKPNEKSVSLYKGNISTKLKQKGKRLVSIEKRNFA